jgi:hypothetical protein
LRFCRASKRAISAPSSNIASVLAFQALQDRCVYSGIKGYADADFTRGLQQELAGTNSRAARRAFSDCDRYLGKSGVPLSTLDPAIVMTVRRICAYINQDVSALTNMCRLATVEGDTTDVSTSTAVRLR